jgi:serine/threonine protein kinase
MISDEREAALLDRALQLPTEKRIDFLEAACVGQPELRLRIEQLLSVQDEAEELFEELGDQNRRRLRGGEGSRQVGRYRLLEELGEGGCGMIYRAEQEEPVRREVALKVIKPGMDTRQVIARFEAERQALAMMEHPNIAKVFDAGATDTGRPYFVMELVRGKKITEYCDDGKLDTKARLDLFIQVCRAVQHAHQKGVIHRDIKPSNVLVTVDCGLPIPKVIDFGIAKATQGQLTGGTHYTAAALFMGTPAYMSPEQAGRRREGVDTRTDIYSLGVLLYELLTGGPPFAREELLDAGFDVMNRTILEKEPTCPSVRLAVLAPDQLQLAADCRSTEPHRLIHSVKGDLDWIILKALAKDRANRYQTVNALILDIERHLRNEPVLACPPSRVDAFRKLYRRNRMGLIAGSVSLAALVLGFGMSTWMFLREKDARQQAVEAKDRAEKEADRRQQIAASLDEVLGKVGPLVAAGKDRNALHEILTSTAHFEEALSHSAALVRMRTSIQVQYRLFNDAAADISRLVAVTPRDSEVLQWQTAIFVQQGQRDAYRAQCRESIETFGSDPDPVVRDRVALDCLILPFSNVEYKRVESMIEHGFNPEADQAFAVRHTLVRMLLEYRIGNFRNVVKRADETSDANAIPPLVALQMESIRALAAYRIQPTAGMESLTEAVAEVETDLAHFDQGDVGKCWVDWIYAHALLREAKAFIDGATNLGSFGWRGDLYRIVNRKTGSYLDVERRDPGDGARVIEWTPTGAKNQEWVIIPATEGEGGENFYFVARHSGKALDVQYNSRDDNARIQQWTFCRSDAQRWKVERIDKNWFSLIAGCSGKALTSALSDFDRTGTLRQAAFTGAEEQQWSFEPLR